MQEFTRRDDTVALTVEVAADAKGAPVVTAARAEGESCPVLDALCRVVAGLPLQEAADHGVLHVAEADRAQGRLAPVPGILTARAAGPAYVRAQGLIRGIMADYRAATGYAETRSTWNPAATAEWQGKDEATRTAELKTRLADFCAGRGLPADAVLLAGTEGDFRVTVEIALDVPAADQPKLLLDLERALRTQTGNRFEVFLQGMQDKNL